MKITKETRTVLNSRTRNRTGFKSFEKCTKIAEETRTMLNARTQNRTGFKTFEKCMKITEKHVQCKLLGRGIVPIRVWMLQQKIPFYSCKYAHTFVRCIHLIYYQRTSRKLIILPCFER